MKIAIPTRHRVLVKTLSLLKEFSDEDVYLFPNGENQMQYDYLQSKVKYGKEGLHIERLYGVSNIAQVRNKILNYFPEGEKIIMMDDDIDAIQKLQPEIKSGKIKNKLVNLTPEEIKEFFDRAFQITEQNNAKLWGVSPVDNPFYMKKSIGNKSFIIGTLFGVINSELRYDGELPLKEDYDFTLQHIIKYKKVIRFNDYTINASHYTNEGGCVEQRKNNNNLEGECCMKLLHKYPHLLQLNPKRENELLIKI